ncbi:MAG: enoyl-CoA hydratase/isomerase family protein [Deltaproteobacteria bacterium]|nr:enoyl-CoA hydratase/isomerase family protein [Deltaproteobacteria bacterium]
MNWETVRVEGDDPIRTLVLNRPQVRNAINSQLLKDLADACTWLERQPDCRVVILRGEGPDFCSGADLKEGLTHGGPLAGRVSRARLGRRAVQILGDMAPVTLAVVRGHAIGGGACLAAACDFRLGARSARVSLREVTLGLSLSWQCIPNIVHLVGSSRARELILFGDLHSAERMAEFGYFNSVVEDEHLLAEAERLARRIAQQPPLPVQMAKASIRAVTHALDRAVAHLDDYGLGLTGGTRDAARAREAFFSGTPAEWELD